MLEGKRIVIYGIGRFQMDFECIFDNLPVAAYLSEDAAEGQYNGKPVYSIGDFSPDPDALEVLAVIVCDFDKDRILAALARKGFTRGKNCFYAEDLFGSLDRLQVDLSSTPVAIWSTGDATREFLEYYSANWDEKLDIRYYLDNDISKQGREYCGKPIRHPSSLSVAELKSAFIIVTTAFYDDIKQQLEERGLIEFRHFVFCTFVLARPSRMLKKVIHAKPRPGPECQHAFSRLIIAMQGVFCCVCSPFLTLPLGNILVQSCEEIWRSITAKIFRLSIVNHTYCFCKLPFCNESDKGKPVRQRYEAADTTPAEVLQTAEFSFDCTCNLRCESCRGNAIHGNAGKIHERIADSLLASPLVNEAENCQCCGGGEVFLGKGFEKLLFSDQAPVRKKGLILTNLQLFSEEKWRKVREHFRRIEFSVSMDGATPETYERIRRGASFETLMGNLRQVSKLREFGEIERFTLGMVVQRKNFKEMAEMVKTADSLGADVMSFVKIMNWGTYSDRQFHEEISMFESDDSTMRPELREIVNAILNSKHETSVRFMWQL